MDASGDELLISRGQALIAISVTSTVLAIGTCGVRFMARKQANRGLWWDDYSVIVSMVSDTTLWLWEEGGGGVSNQKKTILTSVFFFPSLFYRLWVLSP